MAAGGSVYECGWKYRYDKKREEKRKIVKLSRVTAAFLVNCALNTKVVFLFNVEFYVIVGVVKFCFSGEF